jgi:hypothetical protein
VEIFYLFTKNFEPFAKHLLERQPTTPDQQLQWVNDFLKANPLMIDFFWNNPHLPKEKEWKAVEEFRNEILKLKDKLDFLLRLEKKEMPPSVKARYQAAAATARLKLKIDFFAAEPYKQMLLQALDEVYVSKISELVETHQEKMSHFCSLMYPQVRLLLEQANQGLLERNPYQLQPFDFQSLDLLFQAYNAIQVQYPQNVYEYAKYLSAHDQYQDFLAEVFSTVRL